MKGRLISSLNSVANRLWSETEDQTKLLLKRRMSSESNV